MNVKIISAVIVSAFISMANASDLAQANEAVAHAERAYSTAQGSYNKAAYSMGSDVDNSHEAAALQQAASDRAQAYADQRSAQMQADNEGSSLTADNQARTQQQVNALAQAKQAVATNARYTAATMDRSWKQEPGTMVPTATYSEPTKQVSYSGVSTRPGYAQGSINVAVSTLSPSTKVNATVNGVTSTTTAGELAKVNPQIQVAIPHVDALIVSQRQGSDRDRNSSHSEHGTGNGGNNAANSNSAHGLGGGNHIGGGSAQSGSRNVGHW